MDRPDREKLQLPWERIDFHSKRMVGKKEFQIKSELIATLTEYENQILALFDVGDEKV